MDALLRIVFPILLACLMAIGFYKSYRLLNEKISGSQTLGKVLGYAFLLFLSCLILFFGGFLLMFKIYLFLVE
jgi:Ni,Fe-hydrogenase I cytochrome b subunit